MMRRAQLTEDMFGPSLDSPADELVNDAWEGETPSQCRKLARRALAIDLDCIDAYNILALHAESLAERLALLREAVAIGDRLFQPLFGDEEVAWWGFIGTRPYMRALHHFALTLEEAAEFEGAETIYRKLLHLNPNDNQGARMLLLRCFLQRGATEEARRLLADYPDDGSLEMAMGCLLVAVADGRKNNAQKKAREIGNPFVAGLLKIALATGKWPKDSKSAYVEWGSKDEAASWLNAFRMAIERDPTSARKAVDLLEKVGGNG